MFFNARRAAVIILAIFATHLTLNATAANYSCRCTIVSGDHEWVSRYQVSSEELPIDCDDYNGLEVPFMNPQSGAMRSPLLLGYLAACKAVSADKVPKWKTTPMPFPYR